MWQSRKGRMALKSRRGTQHTVAHALSGNDKASMRSDHTFNLCKWTRLKPNFKAEEQNTSKSQTSATTFILCVYRKCAESFCLLTPVAFTAEEEAIISTLISRLAGIIYSTHV